MKVHQLIAELRKLNQNAEVVSVDSDDYGGHIGPLWRVRMTDDSKVALYGDMVCFALGEHPRTTDLTGTVMSELKGWDE